MDIEKLILDRAYKFETKHVAHGYYLENSNREDEGGEYCLRCVGKVPAGERGPWTRYQLDPSNNHDSACHCWTCGKDLRGWLTDYGAEEMLEYFEEDGFDRRSHRDCYYWMLCENSFVKGEEEWTRLMDVAGIESEAKS